jgi:hypothetical protein
MVGAVEPATAIGQLSRMDLDQKGVRDLLPFLTCFAETGRLPVPEQPDKAEVPTP